jgi:hypothetical protein
MWQLSDQSLSLYRYYDRLPLTVYIVTQEIINVLEVPWLANGVVVTTVWKFSPDFSGLAYLEQPSHV